MRMMTFDAHTVFKQDSKWYMIRHKTPYGFHSLKSMFYAYPVETTSEKCRRNYMCRNEVAYGTPDQMYTAHVVCEVPDKYFEEVMKYAEEMGC